MCRITQWKPRTSDRDNVQLFLLLKYKSKPFQVKQLQSANMYSFEGQYRRVPQQNLSGASVHQKRDEILHKAYLDRMKREVSLNIKFSSC